jgi:DNA-directed RNA polymerase subunit RPC12/RpoP
MAVTCENCGREVETTEDVETEPVEELETDAEASGPPRIRHGVGQRDLYRCAGCGKVLGVN